MKITFDITTMKIDGKLVNPDNEKKIFTALNRRMEFTRGPLLGRHGKRGIISLELE